jgi:hypothetical protein
MPVINPTFSYGALMLASLLLGASARADECDRLPPPTVTVKRFEEPVGLDTSYSYKSLKVLAAELSRPGNQVLGLTRATSRVSFSIKNTSYIDRSGRWECSSPQFTVIYGFSPMTVYVAREFPKGGCPYSEIYQHELRHVKAYQDHLVSIERELADTLTRRFATDAVWRAPKGQTRLMLEKEMNERWLPFIKQAIERVEAAQALIDTPEEYARVSGACGGEIERVVR